MKGFKQKVSRSHFILLTLFAIAFAWIESAVVHYLHLHFYPGGFGFPLAEWPLKLSMIEFGRELATVIVLFTAAFLAARTWWSRFAWFMFMFGIWDIFYYIWLVVFEGWPPSLLTTDLLFLVPVPWAGPVLAPIIVSIGLIVSGLFVLKFDRPEKPLSPGWYVSVLVLTGWTLILVSFMWDAGEVIKHGTTGPFRWEIFIAGMIVWTVGLAVLFREKMQRR